MSGEVVSITGEPTVYSGKPSNAAVAYLTDLLERAKSGEVVGVGVIAVHSDRNVSWRTVGMVGGFTMVGAAHCVLQDLVKAAGGE